MQGLETDSATIGQPPHRFEVIIGEAGRLSHDDGFKGRRVLGRCHQDRVLLMLRGRMVFTRNCSTRGVVRRRQASWYSRR